jgi:hypothetical protein
MSSINGSQPVRGRDISVSTWADTDLSALTDTVNAALKALGEVRVLSFEIRSDGTTYTAVAVTTKQG